MDTESMIWGLIFGSVGLAYLSYGKRQSNIVARMVGVGLMVCPYFFENYLTLIPIGVGLMLLPKFLKIDWP